MLGELTSFFKKGAEELVALKDELQVAASDALTIDEPESEEEEGKDDTFKLPRLKPHDYRLRRLNGGSSEYSHSYYSNRKLIRPLVWIRSI
jgi:hypothetical protein